MAWAAKAARERARFGGVAPSLLPPLSPIRKHNRRARSALANGATIEARGARQTHKTMFKGLVVFSVGAGPDAPVEKRAGEGPRLALPEEKALPPDTALARAAGAAARRAVAAEAAGTLGTAARVRTGAPAAWTWRDWSIIDEEKSRVCVLCFGVERSSVLFGTRGLGGTGNTKMASAKARGSAEKKSTVVREMGGRGFGDKKWDRGVAWRRRCALPTACGPQAASR